MWRIGNYIKQGFLRFVSLENLKGLRSQLKLKSSCMLFKFSFEVKRITD